MQTKSEELKWDDIKIGKPLKKLPRNFVALDIESMPVPGHKHGLILSIGIAKFEDNKFVSSQNIYINNSKNTKKPRHFNMSHVKIQPRKDKSTGISLENITRGAALGDAMNRILQILKGNIVVGHDVVNDLKLLTVNMFRFRLKNYACFASIDYYDTLLNEKDFGHELPDMTLKSLSNYYNVSLSHSHNSEQDATASGFVAMAQEISRKELATHETMTKSLLILGNGADLYMGQPTKWTDYWEWRKPYVMGVLGIDAKFINENYTKCETEPPFYEAFYQKFEYMNNLFNNHDNYSRYGSKYDEYDGVWKKYMKDVLRFYGETIQCEHISDYEVHSRSFPNTKLDELYNFENIVIIERVLDKIYHDDPTNIDSLNWSDILFPFLKFVEASSKIKDTGDAEKSFRDMLQSDDHLANHTFNRWWDIEGILNLSTTVLDTLRYGDDKEHGIRGDFFKTDEDPSDELFDILSELSSLLGVQLELLKRNKSNELMADQVLESYVSFEKLFKQYLLENLSGFYNNDKYGYFLKELIAHDKHNFGTGSEFTYDILDFNYEPLYRMLDDVLNTSNHKVFGDIYQPHGNVDESIVIGGNQYKSGPINAKAPLSKTHRNLNLKYEKKGLLYTNLIRKKQQYVQTKSLYKIDLNNYDSIVIYGWSINDVDQAIFAKIFDVMKGYEHNEVDVTVVVNYNDTTKSRADIASNIDALMNNAAAKHGDIRFSVLDEAPDEDN